VLRRAVAQVEVDQALVGNSDLFGDSLEVGNWIFVQPMVIWRFNREAQGFFCD